MLEKSYIGKTLKKVRMEKGISQLELAEKLGVSDKTVSSWEIDRTEPNMVMLEKICEVLQCKKTDIIGRNRYDALDYVVQVADTELIVEMLSNEDRYSHIEKLMSMSQENQEMIFSMIDRLYALEHGIDKSK